MKSLFDLSRVVAIIFVGLLAGCGQKGPLYLPAKSVPVATPAPQMPPVPANTSASSPK